MSFAKPQQFESVVSEKYFLGDSEKFVFVRLELVDPANIEFRAGQYVSLFVDRSVMRSYSIASTPDVGHAIDLVVDISPHGVGTSFIGGLSVGDKVRFLGPLGHFVVPVDSSEADGDEMVGVRKFLFVGTGSGIVPLRSMILDLLINKREKRPIRLHWGLRYESDVFWLDNFERLMEEYDNFVFDLVLSKPNDGWRLCWGHVQDCLLRDVVPNEDMSEWEAYLCGSKEMIESVSDLLEKSGVEKDRIYFERFG